MHKCWYCGKKRVGWQSDYSSEERCYSEDGVESVFVCEYCGAFYTMFVPSEIPEDCERYEELQREKQKCQSQKEC